jgi:hypothetical protein
MERHNQIEHVLIGDVFQVYLMSILSGEVDCDIDHYLVAPKVRERLAVCKSATQVFDMER